MLPSDALAAIDKLRASFTLDEDVYRQHYQKLRPKKAEKAEQES